MTPNEYYGLSLPDLCALINEAWNKVHDMAIGQALFDNEFDVLSEFDKLMNEFSRRMQ